MKFIAPKQSMTQILFHSCLSIAVFWSGIPNERSEIRDPESGMGKNLDPGWTLESSKKIGLWGPYGVGGRAKVRNWRGISEGSKLEGKNKRVGGVEGWCGEYEVDVGGGGSPEWWRVKGEKQLNSYFFSPVLIKAAEEPVDNLSLRINYRTGPGG